MTNFFPSDHDHKIDCDKAKSFIEKFENNHYRNGIVFSWNKLENEPPMIPKSEAFKRDAILQLLATDGCEGIRIYFGQGENGYQTAENPQKERFHLILVPIDIEGKPIWPKAIESKGLQGGPQINILMTGTGVSESGDPIVVENGLPCPPRC
ncbi:hypothetical protein [Solitalea lacus]|uniref:hypothetical protein n=1 Tax=Solitalea lacus TaxID=2911172 RepID=UPI001EDAA345|nr:hypothetical protein [Solitalea lacus]UKJ06333.1 hypothetical protein L2B55_12380 [Solitalea lacus]